MKEWFKGWWGTSLNVLPPLSKSQKNAWFYLNNDWVFVPAGTRFHWGSHVDKETPTLEELDHALLSNMQSTTEVR